MNGQRGEDMWQIKTSGFITLHDLINPERIVLVDPEDISIVAPLPNGSILKMKSSNATHAVVETPEQIAQIVVPGREP